MCTRTLVSVILLPLWWACAPSPKAPDGLDPSEDAESDADADADVDADADADTDTDTDTDTDIDARTVNGFTWCAAGGVSSDGTYTHAGCFAPVDMAPGAMATDSTFTLMPGPFSRVAP